MSDEQRRLGEHVAARRLALGLSYTQVHQQGGPSDTRTRAIENGTGPALRSSTLDKLDTALRWAPGSARAVLNGGDPVPLPASPTKENVPRMSLDEGKFLVSNNEIAQMVASLRELDRQFQSANNAVLADPELHGAYIRHTGVVSTIVGHWVTGLLERNVHADHSLPPILELALGPYLDAEMTHDRSDAEEQLYRRWLAGRDVPLSPEQRAAFSQRLEAARPGH
ncbi:helix-turn-helix domain-containing protein [Dietzia cinnamea]|uniref:helix-turn-helix domain-containing protein n=1 Tax=Dietzia TaxID=37914 RepID=UPI00101AD8E5|nr:MULTISPECIES: helix-turn-helix domain-containing protein [Dietzia]MCT1885775.1 helix-turn-helix domain-containing protein [Dietzia cinnamea]MCT2301360.1 helix-turn-helix domain-containing protein [Dietzia cinnamea]